MNATQSDSSWMAGQPPTGIVTIGDPILRSPASRVAEIDSAMGAFEQMVTTLRHLKGAGLAAPQVGIPLSLVVIEVRKTTLFPQRPESPLIQMANPHSLPLGDDLDLDWEGCFSVPGLMAQVPRHRRVRVSYTEPGGCTVEEEISGYLARVIQHEVDHLNGIIFLDRLPDLTTLATVENYIRLHHRPRRSIS